MEATVILAKCNKSKQSFAIRAQKNENTWLFTWAFNISDKIANNEGYSQNKISGQIGFSIEYPGCPHCGAMGFFQCGRCNKIVCMVGNEKKSSCPHCGNIVEGFKEVNTFNNIDGAAF